MLEIKDKADVIISLVEGHGYDVSKSRCFRNTCIAWYTGSRFVIDGVKPKKVDLNFSIICRETDTDFLISVVPNSGSYPALNLEHLSDLEEEGQYILHKP